MEPARPLGPGFLHVKDDPGWAIHVAESKAIVDGLERFD